MVIIIFEKDMTIPLLVDLYGQVLSDRKRELLDYYYNEDYSLAEIAESRIAFAESEIQQVAESISMPVVDENGQSLMTQTATGWEFSIGPITNSISSTNENVDILSSNIDSVASDVNSLSVSVAKFVELNSYVSIGTYDGNPCIELGKEDNDFKLRITNTQIQFIDGTVTPAYLTNQKLYIENAEVTNELQFGGFVWNIRASGNMGVLWKG